MSERDVSGDLVGDETRRLLDAATPGPWEARWMSRDIVRRALPGECGPTLIVSVHTRSDEDQRANDAELVAAAPRLLARLLAERDAAVARVAELTALLGRHKMALELGCECVPGSGVCAEEADDPCLYCQLLDPESSCPADAAAAPSTPAPETER